MANQRKIEKQITLIESRERIWKALTDPQETKQWYFDFQNFKLEVGQRFYFYEPGGKRKFRHECVITEIKTNERFQHTWTFPELSEGTSILTWDLISTDDKTTIRLSHEGVESLADGGPDLSWMNFESGWDEIVNYLLVDFLVK